jgi:Flp pilus assembly protein TadG
MAKPAAPRLTVPLSAATSGRLRRLEAGQAVVEFALILPVLVLITMGILDLGRVFYTYEALANAAREGARYCALHPGEVANTQLQVTREVNGKVTGVTSSGCTDPGRGQRVTVAAEAPFLPLTPVIRNLVGNTLTVRATATMVAVK